MLALEVELPEVGGLDQVEKIVEQTCTSRKLHMTVKVSLRSYPGSVHWHFRKAAKSGTLEVTFWEQERRLWLSVHVNREGEWTTTEMKALKTALDAEFMRRLGR